MQRLVKVIPFVLACVLALVVYHFAVEEPPHLTAQMLKRLQDTHPHGEVAMVFNGTTLQYEAYGKPAARQFRVQSPEPGTVEFFNAEGKSVMKAFLDQGDMLIMVPKKQTIEAYYFEPFEWLE
jgi:hypothetical protein